MVEQFNNFKGTKHVEQQTTRSVEITGPILDYQPGMTIAPAPKQRSLSPENDKHPLQSSWKNNPMFAPSDDETLDEEDDEDDDDDDDVPEIIKRLSQNGLPAGKQLSDTLSSDMIVNSISNGEYRQCAVFSVMS